MVKTFYVTSEEVGKPLLIVLRERFCLPNKKIKQAVHDSACFINSKVERFSSYKVRARDQITFHIELAQKAPVALEEILYEDDYLIAYNKPPFFSCDKTCNVHRLDKETSGVILHAKRNKEVFQDLFKDREIEKIYYAIAQGDVNQKKGAIESFIGIKGTFQGQKIMGNQVGGKFAKTVWEKLSVKGEKTLLKCLPKTGRTHQIRVHLASIGHPIVGDYQYGRKSQAKAERILLHAHSLKFRHPMKDELLHIKAPIHSDFLEHFNENLYR